MKTHLHSFVIGCTLAGMIFLSGCLFEDEQYRTLVLFIPEEELENVSKPYLNVTLLNYLILKEALEQLRGELMNSSSNVTSFGSPITKKNKKQ